MPETSTIPAAGRYIRLAFEHAQTAGDSHRRYARILQGISSSLVSRGVAVVVSLITVSLSVRFLGAERYGVWITISTALTWITLADFGMSNSLTNALSEAYAGDRKDLAQSYAATAFWLLMCVAAFLTGIFFLVWHRVSWAQVFNVRTAQARAEVAPAVAVAFFIFVLSFPFSSVAKIYGAYQEVAIANFWAAAGSLLSLFGLILVTYVKGNLVMLILAVSGSTLLVSALSAVWVFWKSKPWLLPRLTAVTRPAFEKLSKLGGMFFVIQLAWLSIFQTDNLIIAHFLGARSVTPYSVTWKLFTYASIFQMLAGSSYWPAYAEAFSRGDRSWVRRSFRINFAITVASTLVLACPMVLLGQWIIGKWAGRQVVPTFGLIVWMGIWSVVYAAMTSQACILAGAGRLKGQTVYSVAAAVVNLTLSIILVQKIGLTGVILGTVGAYFICVLIPQTVEVERCLRA
jgi:O-antigen/teichoic acid export membrane protein